jgi:TPR repeat protein
MVKGLFPVSVLSLLSLVLILTINISGFAQSLEFTALKAKAEGGDPQAQLQLAQAYESGKGVRADRFAAADWYLKAAQSGNAEAQNTLAVYLRTGEGGRKDPVEALKWCRLAAKQGYADAMYNLGTAYFNGDGIGIDDVESLAWFAVASDFGSKMAPQAVQRAMTDLAPARMVEGLLSASIKLRLGTEIPRKPEAAVVWLNKAIEMKSMGAEVMLAKLYLDGDGVLRDPSKAWSLCEDAAKRNFPMGMSCLGFIAKGNYGLQSVEPSQSRYWYEKAANCGDAASLYLLGQIYEKGVGVRADAVNAYAHYSLAGRGDANAAAAAKRLEPSLGPKDIKKAQEQTLALIKKINANHKNCQW